MKFYSFRQPYYALIGAETMEDAVDIFISSIHELEDGDEILVDEITEERALGEFIEYLSDELGLEQTIDEFDDIKESELPIFLIDTYLL